MTETANRLGLDHESVRERANPGGVGDLRALKARDNHTNVGHIGVVYLVIALTIVFTLIIHREVAVFGLSPAWSWLAIGIAVVINGASQHQLGGIIHEGTHYLLFKNRTANEVASDWFGAFPIYTSTFHFRLHHLAHHQFINDPQRDPDYAQLNDSGHWLDFPVTHVEVLRQLARQLWLPNLIKFTITRARYSALGAASNPYLDPNRPKSRTTTILGAIMAAGVPIAVGVLLVNGHSAAAFSVIGIVWAAICLYLVLAPEHLIADARLAPVVSHRVTAISRMSYLGLLYTALTAIEASGAGPAWMWFGLLWVVPLFTTFPLFLMLRQWVQHGNADRGRLTNTRVFLVNPVARYAVFPFGMDYHLPHHMYASVPHYNLPQLHAQLLGDPEYRDKGVVVEGYFAPPFTFAHDHHGHGRRLGDAEGRNPTAMDVIGPAYVTGKTANPFIDHSAIADAELRDALAIQREEEASAKSI